MHHLKSLHDSYVVKPIEKTTGNMVFKCQRFHAAVLVKKLEIHGEISSNQGTYVSVIKSKTNIVNYYETF